MAIILPARTHPHRQGVNRVGGSPNRYEGRFDAGWDALREEIFARQKQLGIIPQDAELTARNDTRPMVPICRVPVSPETTTRPGGRRRL